MKTHVNGWRTIERQLIHLGRKQGEIAQLLKITPAAVSQVKKGIFLLNPKQLEKIATFLEFDASMRNDFYTELFNARLLGNDGGGHGGVPYRVCRELHGLQRGYEREIPQGDLSLLANYVPQLEPMYEYMLRNSFERYTGKVQGKGVCTLRIGDELRNTGVTPGSLIVVESGSHPESGVLSLAGLRDGRYWLREFRQDSERIVLRSVLQESGKVLVMKRREVSDLILWVHPVLLLTLRFCC